ncbi:unnamed protein product [Allacma fusca]|uniref:Uncharacterized protein n=1 Tax=Allacma fusca TaxID=39272 RepID=A0A8J2JTU2_9HEXA|nr:unnamed protein product [Allacma fusca]
MCHRVVCSCSKVAAALSNTIDKCEALLCSVLGVHSESARTNRKSPMYLDVLAPPELNTSWNNKNRFSTGYHRCVRSDGPEIHHPHPE